MARDQEIVEVAQGEWIELSNADVTTFNLRVIRGQISLRFTAGATPPAADATGLFIPAGTGIVNRAVADMCALAGANRIYAKGITAAEVYIDHA